MTQIKETVVEDFRLGIALVEKLAKESLAEYPLALELALSDISAVRKLVSAFDTSQSEEIMKLMNEFMCVNAATTGILELEQDSSESKIGTPLRLTAKAETSTVTAVIDGSIQKLSLKCKFPAVIKRDMFMRSLLWRHHLKKIHDYIEALRARYAQPPIPPASTPSTGAKAQGEGVFSADPPVSSADEVDVKSIRDLYMNDATSLPYSSKIARGEEGILDEAIEDIEDAAIKFVLSPAMSTVRASVNTVVTIGQTAATIGQMLTPAGLISADNTMDTGADGTDRKSFSNEVVKEHSSMLGDLDKRDHHKSVTRIGKLKTKLLGKDSSASASGSFNNEFSEGRLGLPAGRAGIVLEVHEEELATVIAYSLASVEYEQKVSEYLQQAELLTNSTGDGVLPDVEHRGPAVSSVIAADTPGIQVTSRMQSITRGDRSTSRASVDDFGGSPQSAVGEIQGQYDDEDDYRHEGEVTDIHLTDDPTYAIAGERLGAAFKEGGDELAVEQTPRLAGLDSESNSAVFGFSGNEAKDIVGDGLNEMGRFENVDTESRNNRSRVIEKQLSSQRKSHIKHRFIDDDEKGSASCKFICHTFWACQFEALRAAFLEDDGDEGYIRSLGASAKWQAQGGKSGASFSKTLDGRFVVKYITRTELQMFLDFAPAYFEYMQKVFFLGLPTFLCKVLGVYQIGYHNRITGKKVFCSIFAHTLIIVNPCFAGRSWSKLLLWKICFLR